MPINIQDYLLGRIPVGRKIDIPAYLMAKAASGGIQEISGTLPLTVRSRASQILKNYRIYGTASGAGVETENLWDESWVNGVYSSVGAYTSNLNAIASDPNKPIPVHGGTTYYIRQFKNVSKIEVFFYSRATEGFIKYDTIDPAISNSFVTPQSATYMRFDCYRGYGTVYANDIVISTAFPTVYIPHGYKLPITVTSNGTTTDYPVYIGDSQLGEEEYVDYESGKIYKMVDGTLTPTDPPVPLPDISLPQGEVTIDTEEELKPQATIEGKIKQIT